MMQIIPVIDLLNGEVVHAKKGLRQQYQSLQSELCASSDPLVVVAALLALYPFEQLYIADLNAIQKLADKAASNYAVIEKISRCYPELDIWLDAGIKRPADRHQWQPLKLRLILASENCHDMQDYLALSQQQDDFILSLDFFSDGFHGPQALLTHPENWPKQVIIMSLADVGSNQGVNTARLKALMPTQTKSHFYAAGGVRDSDDLLLLKKIGVHGVLLATALHTRQITGADLLALQQ